MVYDRSEPHTISAAERKAQLETAIGRLNPNSVQKVSEFVFSRIPSTYFLSLDGYLFNFYTDADRIKAITKTIYEAAGESGKEAFAIAKEVQHAVSERSGFCMANAKEIGGQVAEYAAANAAMQAMPLAIVWAEYLAFGHLVHLRGENSRFIKRGREYWGYDEDERKTLLRQESGRRHSSTL